MSAAVIPPGEGEPAEEGEKPPSTGAENGPSAWSLRTFADVALLSAFAWTGAVALALVGLAVGLHARAARDERQAVRLAVVSGILVGAAFLYRLDFVIACTLAIAVLVWGAPRRRAIALVASAIATASLVLVHFVMAGFGNAFRGMVLEPVFEGDAGSWVASAKAHKWTVTSIPSARSLVVFPGAPGHVGYVDAVKIVKGVVKVTITDMNRGPDPDHDGKTTGFNKFTTATYSADSNWKYILIPLS